MHVLYQTQGCTLNLKPYTHTLEVDWRKVAVQEASAMYLEAVELMEDDGKESMALDIFRQAIGRLFPHMFHM